MKLYKIDVNYDAYGIPSESIVEATSKDIADAHPKCGECDFVRLTHGDWHCTNPESPYFKQSVIYGALKAVDPITDYCNKWEATP